MMEKYLNDTLRTDRLKEVERIAGTNLMPGYLARLQYIEDSTRAYKWFEMTKDSSYIRKFLNRSYRVEPFHENNEIKRSAFLPIHAEIKVNTVASGKPHGGEQQEKRKEDHCAPFVAALLNSRERNINPQPYEPA
jgi:hypothetical protein